jgi:hypothetical protein
MKASHLDILGGVALVAAGGLAVSLTWHLDAGTPAEIGPGGTPRFFALVLAALGVAQIAVSMRPAVRRTVDKAPLRFAPRLVLFVLGAVVAFGLLVQPLGILGAAPALLLLAGFATPETKWREYAPLVIGLPIFCALLFRLALGLPIPLAPWLLGY